MRISKKKPILLPTLLWAALAGSLQAPALADDTVAGRSKAQILCQNCHGLDGVALLPGAANLSGQQKEYLMAQLRAYRSGSRQSAHMSVVAKTLTDADIENLSTWYSAIKVTVEMPK